MSVLVAKMFEADMTEFTFVFSKVACIKTCIYFAVMYLAVMVFNTITVSRYKLINLLHANKKNETVRLRNPIIAILVFIIGCVILGFAYYKVTGGVSTINTMAKIIPPVIMGIVSTVLIFWSLSGFILKIVQMMKGTYLKGTNMFVLRQLNNKINTTVASMSVICLMLFLTITILSSSLSIRNTLQGELAEMTPVDLNLYKTANLPESIKKYGKTITYTKDQREESKKKVSQTLKENGLDMNVLKDVIEIETYATNNITLGTFLGDKLAKFQEKYAMLGFDTREQIIKISDYNKIAKMYKLEEYLLNDDEFIVICNFDNMKALRDEVLSVGNYELEIAGKTYKSKYNECKDGYIEMQGSRVNTGIILVPDSCNLTEEDKESYFLAANYNAKTEDEKKEIEKNFTSSSAALVQRLAEKGYEIDGTTRITIIESSMGLGTIITFIALYLGIIFLIASSAILALKQLTESSDNKQRYTVLRRIGCDEKMINRALFRQIGIFFILPLILAIIHSVFGIKFVISMMDGLASKEQLIPSIIWTVVVFGIVYGAYFVATYFGSKRVIKEE